MTGESMDKHTLKADRENSLRKITNTAGLLALEAQSELNGKLKELVALILKTRAEEQKGGR
jgi:hypothetical protein